MNRRELIKSMMAAGTVPFVPIASPSADDPGIRPFSLHVHGAYSMSGGLTFCLNRAYKILVLERGNVIIITHQLEQDICDLLVRLHCEKFRHLGPPSPFFPRNAWPYWNAVEKDFWATVGCRLHFQSRFDPTYLNPDKVSYRDYDLVVIDELRGVFGQRSDFAERVPLQVGFGTRISDLLELRKHVPVLLHLPLPSDACAQADVNDGVYPLSAIGSNLTSVSDVATTSYANTVLRHQALLRIATLKNQKWSGGDAWTAGNKFDTEIDYDTKWLGRKYPVTAWDEAGDVSDEGYTRRALRETQTPVRDRFRYWRRMSAGRARRT